MKKLSYAIIFILLLALFPLMDAKIAQVVKLPTSATTTDGSLNSSAWNRTEGNVFLANPGDNVGIGTSSPTYILDVAGELNLNKGITSGSALKVNGSEALWYNGTYFSWGFGGSYNYFSDRVNIGNTTSGEKFSVQNNSSGVKIARFQNNSTSSFADGIIIRTGPNVNPGAGNRFIQFYDGDGTSIGSIAGNGSGGITYNTTSDRRLKQNITDVNNSLGIIEKIRPREFEFKTNPGTKHIGFIAQELKITYPDRKSVV